MCGDFNIDLLQYDKHNATNNFIDQLYSLGLHPLITRPTSITSHSNTLIDNTFTTSLSNIQSGLIINDISDHLPIFQITEYIHNKRSNVTYYNTFTEKLTKIYNTTCPIIKQKIVNKRPDKPWMTNSLKQACKKKNLLYRQFLKKRSITSEEK